MDVKRLKIPYNIEDTCPKCSKAIRLNLLGDDYLSFPVLGKSMPLHFYCENCDNEWGKSIILDISLVEG